MNRSQACILTGINSLNETLNKRQIGNTFDRPTSKLALSPMLHRNEAIRVQPLPRNRLSLPKMELNVELGLELPCKTHLRMVRYASGDGFVFTAPPEDYNHNISCCSELPPVEGPDD